MYTGGCDCNAVQISLLSDTMLDETYDGSADCNCNICGRVSIITSSCGPSFSQIWSVNVDFSFLL